MDAAAISLGIHCVLLFGLGLWISLYRFFKDQYYFAGGGPTAFITKLSRSHGNTAEFSPMLGTLTLALYLLGSESMLAQAAMLSGAVSRCLVVLGFLTSHTLEQMSLPKAIGAMGTYASGLMMTILLVGGAMH